VHDALEALEVAVVCIGFVDAIRILDLAFTGTLADVVQGGNLLLAQVRIRIRSVVREYGPWAWSEAGLPNFSPVARPSQKLPPMKSASFFSITK